MKSKLLSIVAVMFFGVASARSQSQSYQSELQIGIDSYKNSHYEEAIEHFRNAVRLDPDQNTARMYLATTYVSNYIPGVDSKDNIAYADQAIEQYLRVLDSDSTPEQKVNSAKSLAYLYMSMKKFVDAPHYYERASGLDPNDPEPYYSIGVIDWTDCYTPRMEARSRLGLRPEESLNAKIPAQKKACDELQARNTSIVLNGIESLRKALELRTDYDDAMAYINLMYREKADLECDNPSLRAEDLKTADAWVDKTLATKKIKAAKAEHRLVPTGPSPQ